MARPTKKGVDQLLLDVGIFGDNKIRILLSRYHADGLGVYMYILCDVYKEGYYKAVEVWEDYIYVIADEIKASPDKVEQIITFMRNRGLLTVFKGEDVKKTGYDFDAVITSHGIQKRYATIMKSYRRKSIDEIKRGFWLLSEEEEAEIMAFYKSGNNGDYYGKIPIITEITPINPEKNRHIIL